MRWARRAAMGIVVLSSVATAIAMGWFVYVGHDPKLGRAGRYSAPLIAVVLGGAMAVAGCIMLEGRAPRSRLLYSLLFAAVAALSSCILWFCC